MTTYNLPTYVIAADANGFPTSAYTSSMEFVAPNSEPSFSYSVIRVEDFDGLGNSNVVLLNQAILSKTVNEGTINVPESNYHAIFEVSWGAGNRSIVMMASASETTRVGIVLDGDPFPSINSLSDYYAWVDTFSSLSPVMNGPFGPGQPISYADFPGVALSASALTIGTPGNDLLESGPGDDVIDGMDGFDTLVLNGDQSQYTLTLSPGELILNDRMAEGTGTDALISVERLEFQSGAASAGGGTLNMDTLDGITSLTSAELTPIIELYIAYFNRAPDAVGLAFWGNSYAEGVGMEEMAALFMDQDETRATYSDTMSNAQFLTAIYNNVLGRDPDAEGFAFWLDHLDAGSLGRDTFILDVLGGAKVEPLPGASASHIANLARDQQYLTDKTDIGANFAVSRGMSDVNDASNAMAFFDGSQGSIQDAISAINGHYADALSTGSGDFLMPLVGVLDDPFTG